MSTVFSVVLNKTVVMMALMAVGYFFGRKKIVSGNIGRDLGVLETRFLLPAYIFLTLSENVVPDKLASNTTNLLWGLAFLAITLVLSFAFSKLTPGGKLEKLMAYYMFAFPNFGYFGYPVVKAAFGNEVLSQFIIFALPFTIALYTYGAYILTTKREPESTDCEKKEKKKFSIKSLKSLPFEVLGAVVLGSVVGLTQIKLPAVITDFFDFSAQCMSPVSMLLAGFILSALPLSQLFRSLRAYIVSAIKVIAMPAVVGAVLWLIGLRGIQLIFPVAFSAMPVGMNVVIFSRPEQPDYTSTVVTCFISYILALLSVPLTFAIISSIA